MERRGTPSAFVISITPFDESGAIDWDGTRAHWQRLEDAGIGVYVGGGGSGEGHTLVEDEVDALLALAAHELVGSVPTRAMGVEPRTARQMIEFGKKVKGHGLDAMQIYSLDMGHLGIPRPQEQERYFREVLETIDMPSVISTHFSVGYMVPVELLTALCDDYPHVIGINCSIGPDFTYLVRVLDEVPAHVEVHVGGPMHTMSALAMGGTGFLSSEANVIPQLANSVVRLYGAGDYEAAAAAYSQVLRVFTLLSSRVSAKALLKALGLPGGDPRLPRMLLTTEDDTTVGLRKLAEMGIPELAGLLPGVRSR
jgi:4-hydroxy-tetrahydrodipicolinate synthase